MHTQILQTFSDFLMGLNHRVFKPKFSTLATRPVEGDPSKREVVAILTCGNMLEPGKPIALSAHELAAATQNPWISDRALIAYHVAKAILKSHTSENAEADKLPRCEDIFANYNDNSIRAASVLFAYPHQ